MVQTGQHTKNKNMQTITKTQAQSLSTSGLLDAGEFYKISDVMPSLYGGTDIIIQAITGKLFAAKAVGIFFNPKYTETPIAKIGQSYSIGAKVIWGGYLWECNTNCEAASLNILNLDSNWDKATYSETDYNIAVDAIEYDFLNDRIVSRHELSTSNSVSQTQADFDFLNDADGLSLPAITVFQWGNGYDFNTGKGLVNCKINNSYFECINFDGLYISNVELNKRSTVFNNSIESHIDNVQMNNRSAIYNAVLSGSAAIYNTVLNSAAIYGITIPESKAIRNTTVNNSKITGTIAEVLFGNFDKAVTVNEAGEVKIIYINSDNELIIAQ